MTHNTTLTRDGADIIVTETASASRLVIKQTIDGETDAVILNNNEIDAFIEVLKAYQKAIRG